MTRSEKGDCVRSRNWSTLKLSFQNWSSLPGSCRFRHGQKKNAIAYSLVEQGSVPCVLLLCHSVLRGDHRWNTEARKKRFLKWIEHWSFYRWPWWRLRPNPHLIGLGGQSIAEGKQWESGTASQHHSPWTMNLKDVFIHPCPVADPVRRRPRPSTPSLRFMGGNGRRSGNRRRVPRVGSQDQDEPGSGQARVQCANALGHIVVAQANIP